MVGAVLTFEFPEDRSFFEKLLCVEGEVLEMYADLFDRAPPARKRLAFKKFQARRFDALVDQFGSACMLKYAPDCDPNDGLVIDHLIPLSSNRLNKELRGARGSRSAEGAVKKAPSQSFGSNHARNLILACHNCNSAKQNRFIESAVLRRVLAITSSIRPSTE